MAHPIDPAGADGRTRASRWRRVAGAALLAGVAVAAGVVASRLAIRPAPPELPGFYPMVADPARADLPFVDQQGARRTLSDFRGRVVVLFFGFVRCPDVCPTRLFELAQLLGELGDDAGRVQVVMVTLDPERDTPAVLAAYLAAFNPAFAGATGTPGEVDALARAFYVAYRKVPVGADYTLDHSAATYLVAPSGRQAYSSGIDTTKAQLLAAVRALAEEAR